MKTDAARYKIRKDMTAQEELRYAITDTIEALSQHDTSLVVLDADLTLPSGVVRLLSKTSPVAFNLGVMEANMVGVASGLSLVGFKPFMHTFSSFATRKCLDQIFMTSAYTETAMTMLASDPGLCAQVNGGTHTVLEDIGVFTSFPNVEIYDICDAVQAKWAVAHRVNHHAGFGYLRYPRRPLKAIYEEHSVFEYGKAPIVREGSDVGIFASGIMLSIAVDVAQILQEHAIHARIVDCFSLSNPDVQTIVETAQRCTHIVSLDNHNIHTGLGSIIANVLAEHAPHRLHKFGTTSYGQVGTLNELLPVYQLDARTVADKIQMLV